jgi:uncharacterized protein
MGAALVLESMRAEPRFCAVVADSPFSTFRSVAYDREGYFVGVGRLGLERWIGRTVGLLPAEIAFLYARCRYGADLLQTNPLDILKHSTIPVLLIHGADDINILPQHSRVLVQANAVHAQL